MNGKTVAKNRKKRMDQRTDSLEEWYQKQVRSVGKKEAERKRSQLTVVKSYRRYNEPGRVMAGAILIYQGKRYVLRNRITNGQYYHVFGSDKNIPAKKCMIEKHNEGLVFLA